MHHDAGLLKKASPDFFFFNGFNKIINMDNLWNYSSEIGYYYDLRKMYIFN